MATAAKKTGAAPKAAPPAPAAAEVQRYVYDVHSPLDHDNKRYEPGSTVNLTEAEAAQLSADVITPAAE